MKLCPGIASEFMQFIHPRPPLGLPRSADLSWTWIIQSMRTSPPQLSLSREKKLYILLPGSDPAVSACFPWKWNDEIVTAACVKISVIWVLSRLHFITELWPESEQPAVVTAESGLGDTAWSTGYQWWSFETRRNQKSWRMGSLKRWVKSCNISLVIHFNFQSHDYERVSKILVQFTTRGLITNHKMQITLTRSDLIVSSMRQNNFQFYVSIKYWQCFII